MPIVGIPGQDRGEQDQEMSRPRLKTEGDRYGRLTVVKDFGTRECGPNGRRETFVACLCDCGNRIEIRLQSLRSGNTRSCGCIRRERAYKDNEDPGRFGRLTIVEELGIREFGRRKYRRPFVACLCDCGNRIEVPLNALRSGNTESCGCLQKERFSEAARIANTKHGEGRTLLHGVWWSMKSRCTEPGNASYPRYGKRGIRVCDSWLGSYAVFAAWARANGYRRGLSLDRIDNDGHYEPSNCRWATRSEQARNTRSNRYIEAFGERKLLTDWAADPRFLTNRCTFDCRIKAGWPAELAMTAGYHEYRMNPRTGKPEPRSNRSLTRES